MGHTVLFEELNLFREVSLISNDLLFNQNFHLCRIKGLKYIRTTRSDTPVIYTNKDKFNIGDFKVHGNGKKYVLVGAGITLHECLKVAKRIKECSVVDLYCIKPFNSKKFKDFAKKHGNKLIITEDHYKEGGIGEMLFEELANSGIKIKHLAVHLIPHSGTKE